MRSSLIRRLTAHVDPLVAWFAGIAESIRVRSELIALEREARDARRRATYRTMMRDPRFARAVHDELTGNPRAQDAWLDGVAAATDPAAFVPSRLPVTTRPSTSILATA